MFKGSYDEELVDWLYGLPPQAELDGTLYVHGSPLSDVESFHPTREDDDERLLNGVRDRTVVFGHSHQQFRRPGLDDTQLLNPGSVGMPLDGDVRAAWATWDGDFEFRRTEYDVAKAAAGYRSLGGEFGEFAAKPDREGLGLDRVASTEISTFPFSACETGQFSFGALGRFEEFHPVDPLDLAIDGELDRRQPEAGLRLVEGRRRLRLEPRRRVAVLGQRVSERHRDAGRMRRGDQLLGAHSFGVLGPGRPGHALDRRARRFPSRHGPSRS